MAAPMIPPIRPGLIGTRFAVPCRSSSTPFAAGTNQQRGIRLAVPPVATSPRR
jgi:hypothetical protein